MASTRPSSDRPPIRRVVVTLTICSFSVSALLGVLALVSGGLGEIEARVLLTTVLVGVAGIAVLCYLGAAGTPFQAVGVAGGVTVLVPLGAGLLMIWGGEWPGEATGEAFGVGAVVAVTLAQACLLLELAHRASPVVRVLLALTLVLAGLLAAILSGLVLGLEGDATLTRVIGVVAILAVLGTLVVSALAGVGDRAADRPELLALPPGLAAELDRRAAQEGRTREGVAVEAIEQYLRAPTP